MRVCIRLSALIDHAPARLACSARVDYPNGDTFEGGFNELKQRHGRGVYTWSSRPGAHPWVPEEGAGELLTPQRTRRRGESVVDRTH